MCHLHPETQIILDLRFTQHAAGPGGSAPRDIYRVPCKGEAPCPDSIRTTSDEMNNNLSRPGEKVACAEVMHAELFVFVLSILNSGHSRMQG